MTMPFFRTSIEHVVLDRRLLGAWNCRRAPDPCVGPTSSLGATLARKSGSQLQLHSAAEWHRAPPSAAAAGATTVSLSPAGPGGGRGLRAGARRSLRRHAERGDHVAIQAPVRIAQLRELRIVLNRHRPIVRRRQAQLSAATSGRARGPARRARDGASRACRNFGSGSALPAPARGDRRIPVELDLRDLLRPLSPRSAGRRRQWL